MQKVKSAKATTIDVRSVEEFRSGNVAGSVNIPIQEIPQRLDELKNLKIPLVLCCASGNRSGMAQRYLTAQGIECSNGGSWMDAHFNHTQNA